MAPLRVLITNDDGPPGRESPFIFGLFQELRKLGIHYCRGAFIVLWLTMKYARLGPKSSHS
jgi:hypothetical protein